MEDLVAIGAANHMFMKARLAKLRYVLTIVINLKMISTLPCQKVTIALPGLGPSILPPIARARRGNFSPIFVFFYRIITTHVTTTVDHKII